jgi:hypothetical protein
MSLVADYESSDSDEGARPAARSTSGAASAVQIAGGAPAGTAATGAGASSLTGHKRARSENGVDVHLQGGRLPGGGPNDDVAGSPAEQPHARRARKDATVPSGSGALTVAAAAVAASSSRSGTSVHRTAAGAGDSIPIAASRASRAMAHALFSRQVAAAGAGGGGGASALATDRRAQVEDDGTPSIHGQQQQAPRDHLDDGPSVTSAAQAGGISLGAPPQGVPAQYHPQAAADGGHPGHGYLYPGYSYVGHPYAVGYMGALPAAAATGATWPYHKYASSAGSAVTTGANAGTALPEGVAAARLDKRMRRELGLTAEGSYSDEFAAALRAGAEASGNEGGGVGVVEVRGADLRGGWSAAQAAASVQAASSKAKAAVSVFVCAEWVDGCVDGEGAGESEERRLRPMSDRFQQCASTPFPPLPPACPFQAIKTKVWDAAAGEVRAEEEPGRMQKRKHQIGFLAAQAAAGATDGAAEARAAGMRTKAQTWGKYGW